VKLQQQGLRPCILKGVIGSWVMITHLEEKDLQRLQEREGVCRLMSLGVLIFYFILLHSKGTMLLWFFLVTSAR